MLNFYRICTVALAWLFAFPSLTVASDSYDLTFSAVVDRLIVPGKHTLSGGLEEGDVLTGSLSMVETERFKGTSVTENGGLQYWQNTVKSMKFGEPLNVSFEGIYMGLNPSLEQLTISFDAEKCNTQPVLKCSVQGDELLAEVSDSSTKSYSPIDYLLIHPGLKDSSIEFSEAIDLLVDGVPNGDSKVILKMGASGNDSDLIRIILKLTDMDLVGQ